MSLPIYKLFFASLSNPHRLQIVNVLRQQKLNVSEITAKTGFEQTMVSHNLRRLERCGMVFAEQRGKNRYYTLNHKTIKPLLKLIDNHVKEYCCKILEEK